MANICLRNPQYKSINVNPSSVKSTICYITIDGILRYEIVKNKGVLSDTSFEISELCRDYLLMNYSGNNTVQKIAIQTVLENRTGLNGTGNVTGNAVTFTDKGYEAYGTFIDGANPVNPVQRSLTGGTWLLAAKSNSYADNFFEIFMPINESGFVAGMNSAGVDVVHTVSSTDTSIDVNDIGDILNINRINCSKYGNGRQIVFVNKYGAQQDLWFSLKEVQSLSRKNESYKSNTLLYDDSNPYYLLSDAPVKTFNTNAKKTYTLSSGYYPEWAVEYFEQLLLSEYIWMKVYRKENPASELTIPVKVKSSSIKLKTSLNDKLIDYTIEFEDAFDYINNIR